ncbi:MAG: SDR family oxidoreductase [bacterium]
MSRGAERVVLVTGGGTGIGRAIAERFARDGCRVAVTGRRKAPLEDVVRSIGPERGLAIPGDVTSGPDRDRLIRQVIERFGALDVLVNNAGVVASIPVVATSDAEWRRQFETNVVAAMALSRAAMDHLRDRKGCILNVSTGASGKPVPGYGVYGATKAALEYASRVLALEAAPDVRVNVVSPGGVETPIFDTFLTPDQKADTIRYFDEATPLGRIGRPADIAAAAAWLCSPEAGWVTGTVLVVDGGLNLG